MIRVNSNLMAPKPNCAELHNSFYIRENQLPRAIASKQFFYKIVVTHP